MSGITRFEDIDAWKAARELTNQIYAVTCEGTFAKDYGLKEQIQRAANSIMANVAEGFDGGSDREFIKFLGYARRSATEVQSHLYVALDQHYIEEREFLALYEKTGAVKSLISGFIRYLRTQPGS